MKILYFHQHFSTPQGATGARSWYMAKRLVQQGHQVIMVCGSYQPGNTGLTGGFVNGVRRGEVDGFKVIEFDLAYSNSDPFIQRTKTFLRYSVRGIRLALFESCDLVFATSTPLTAALPGIFARLFRRKPFVFEVRDLWPELPKAMRVISNPVALALMSLLEWAAYNCSNRQIALSPGIREGVIAKTGKPQNVALVPNGCDLELFSPDVKPWRPHGVAESDFVAIFAGAHGIANGLDALLDAAVVLKRRGQQGIKIVMVGDGKLKSALIDRARAEQLDNLIFVDPVPKERLAGLLKGADVGLQILANVPAFYYGTSPNKFFDYISAGLPVINNYPGWLADMIRGHDCGYVVEPGVPQEFADTLEQAADDRQKLVKMGIRARALAEEQFGWRKLSERWLKWVTGWQVGRKSEAPSAARK